MLDLPIAQHQTATAFVWSLSNHSRLPVIVLPSLVQTHTDCSNQCHIDALGHFYGMALSKLETVKVKFRKWQRIMLECCTSLRGRIHQDKVVLLAVRCTERISL